LANPFDDRARAEAWQLRLSRLCNLQIYSKAMQHIQPHRFMYRCVKQDPEREGFPASDFCIH